MNVKSLTEIIEARKRELFDLLSDLIQIDSQNFGEHGRESAVAEHIARVLADMGFEPDIYSPDSIYGIHKNPDCWAGHHLENRPNVSCVIPSSAHDRRILIVAHSDTVPVGDLLNWTFDPFCGTQTDGKIPGRGACDDKYGIATALFLIRVFKDEGVVLPYDLVFTAYYDEERGGGNGTLAVCLKYPCDDIINLDCKDFEIWAGASGGGELSAYIRSKKTVDSCLSLLPGLKILADKFEAFKERRMAELEEQPRYTKTIIPGTSVRFMDVHAGDHGFDLDRASCCVCFYTSKTQAEIQLELDEMRESLNKKLEPLILCFDHYAMDTRFFHFMLSDMDSPLLNALIVSGAEVSGRELKPCGSCLSDLSLFLKYGSKRAFAFGIGCDFAVPGGAHQANEFIEMAPLTEFAKIIGAALTRA